jgi:YidC/Oxa1 family membrane protein insertase
MKNTQIMKLITPELKETREKINTYRQSGEHKLAKIESEKMKKLQSDFGFKTNKLRTALNVFQIILMGVWAGLVQRFSFKIEDYPEMMTGGFFWFKDLSMSDPYFILPLINAFSTFYIIYVSS